MKAKIWFILAVLMVVGVAGAAEGRMVIKEQTQHYEWPEPRGLR